MKTRIRTKQPLNRIRALYLALPLCLLLAGCQPAPYDFDDLKDFVRNSGTDMRGKIEPPPELNLEPPVDFIGSGAARQPFDPARLGRDH